MSPVLTLLIFLVVIPGIRGFILLLSSSTYSCRRNHSAPERQDDSTLSLTFVLWVASPRFCRGFGPYHFASLLARNAFRMPTILSSAARYTRSCSMTFSRLEPSLA